MIGTGIEDTVDALEGSSDERIRKARTVRTLNLRLGSTLQKYGTPFWAVIDAAEELVCITVYKRGAPEVVRRLAG